MVQKVPLSGISGNSSFKNYIINGDYAIAQRASSATTAGNGTYTTLDRWQTYNATDGAYTTARTALSAADQATTGQYYAYDIQCSTADSSIGASQYAFVLQKIEAQFLQALRFGTSDAQPVTISFYVKSNLTGTTCGFVSKEDSTFTMCPFEFTINSANTWERKTATIPVNDVIQLAASAITYDNGPGISVGFNLAMGSNLDNGTNLTWEATTAGYATSNQLNFLSNTANDLFITGVQFEVGNDATDFEYLPHDVQLQRCIRYFRLLKMQGIHSGTYQFANNWSRINPTYANAANEMRDVPSASWKTATPTFDASGTALTTDSNEFRWGYNGTTVDTTPSATLGIDNIGYYSLSIYNSGINHNTNGSSGFVSFKKQPTIILNAEL